MAGSVLVEEKRHTDPLCNPHLVKLTIVRTMEKVPEFPLGVTTYNKEWKSHVPDGNVFLLNQSAPFPSFHLPTTFSSPFLFTFKISSYVSFRPIYAKPQKKIERSASMNYYSWRKTTSARSNCNCRGFNADKKRLYVVGLLQVRLWPCYTFEEDVTVNYGSQFLRSYPLQPTPNINTLNIKFFLFCTLWCHGNFLLVLILCNSFAWKRWEVNCI